MKLKFISKRIILSIISLWVVATILFLMFRLIPGDPTAIVADPSLSPEARQLIIERHGLDEPLYVQYFTYMQNLVTGDLGMSFQRDSTVVRLLIDYGANTLVLMLPSVLLAFSIGPMVGAFLAWHKNERIDTIGVGFVLFFYAAPVFWTGMVGIIVFSFWQGWLPTGGMRSAGAALSEGFVSRVLSIDFLRHLLLPLVITTLYWLTIPALVMRNNMIDVLGADYIELSRAQGLSEFTILYQHAARNAFLPVLHYWALAIGFAFGGSVIIETVFSWPGVGLLMWDAVLQFDYPVAQGAFLFIASIIIIMNMLADIFSVYVDPRVEEKKV